jgi:hypothetical protein
MHHIRSVECAKRNLAKTVHYMVKFGEKAIEVCTMDDSSSDKAEQVKLGVWVTPDERNQLYECTKLLGFSTFSDFIRTIASIPTKLKIRAIGQLRTLLANIDKETPEVYALARIDQEVLPALAELAAARGYTLDDYASEALATSAEAKLSPDSFRAVLDSLSNQVSGLLQTNAILLERLAFVEKRLTTEELTQECRTIAIPYSMVEPTKVAIAGDTRAKRSFEEVMGECEEKVFPGILTSDKRIFYVGQPPARKVRAVLHAVHAYCFKSGFTSNIGSVRPFALLSMWERAFARLGN